MASYKNIPSTAKGSPISFDFSFPQPKLDHLRQVLELHPLGREAPSKTLRGSSKPQWFGNAKEIMRRFDWAAEEELLKAFPHYVVGVEDTIGGQMLQVHFVALFSTSPDAIPVLLIHSWFSSYVEYLCLLSVFTERFPQACDLPFHVIVPSLPGYDFSSPLSRETNNAQINEDNARVLNQLMVNLGFGAGSGGIGGYVVHGGVSSLRMCYTLAKEYKDCRALHANLDGAYRHTLTSSGGDEFEAVKSVLAELHPPEDWDSHERDMIRLAISTSPVSLLALIGSQFFGEQEQGAALRMVALIVAHHWMTDTYPDASQESYCIKDMSAEDLSHVLKHTGLEPNKPVGISFFSHGQGSASDIRPIVDGSSWSSRHEGNPFVAVLDQPNQTVGDLLGFVRQVQKQHS
uniref:Putative epoxide hydrolase AFT8 n=1 Tax=Alternaria alternata TaxID=5599 RepID=AFT8_ALTAL|nr:RecName: Full=Putative epoxide hydrolase AFT8; AltName: Full=AF-toxin biosynthesis protein 8 [Alternaria alternata]BAO05507.1 epoxide hydrolase involved in AF-toxin production [Alternaria alternata]